MSWQISSFGIRGGLRDNVLSEQEAAAGTSALRIIAMPSGPWRIPLVLVPRDEGRYASAPIGSVVIGWATSIQSRPHMQAADFEFPYVSLPPGLNVIRLQES